MNPRGSGLRSRLGGGIFALAGAAGLWRALAEDTHGHYRMFMGAAGNLWAGAQAYDVPYLGNLYFYSPTCALYFFGPLSRLPETAGLALYLLLSIAVFATGGWILARTFLSRPQLQCLAFLIAPHFYAAIAAHKLELLVCGLAFWATAWLVQGRRLVASALLYAVAVNFKLQPLPAAALMSLVLLMTRDRRRSWMIYGGVFLALLSALPYLARPAAEITRAYGQWSESLNRYSRQSFDFYDNVFAFLANDFGLHLSYGQAQALGALCAAVLAAGLAFRVRRGRNAGLIIGLGFGFAYTTLFSPLQQINATLLFAPVYALALALRGRVAGRDAEASRRSATRWSAAIATTWAVLALGYSDLIPQTLRPLLRHAAIRPLACLLLTVAVAIALCIKPRDLTVEVAAAGT